MTLAREVNIDAVIAGTARLSPDQALRLYHEATLHDLGRWATAVAHRLHGQTHRTYVIDRNINYSNICTAHCTFCAFRRDADDNDAYLLSREQLHEKIQALADIGGTQVLLQGGMHPDLPIEFYEQMLRDMRQAFPNIHLHAFSPPEIVEFVAIFDIPGFPKTAVGQSHTMPPEQWQAKLDVILDRLIDAGLASIPGGGGEIFAPQVRRRIGLGKATADQWLAVMSAAHRKGLLTSATMMFGHVEGVADRIDHMRRVRDAQDQAINNDWPGRYVSFISWPFQRENTPMGRMPEFDRSSGEPFPGDLLATGTEHPKAGKIVRMAGASEYLRMQAISRLFLDNVSSIGSSWVTMGPKIGQLGLFYGANDMGSVMMEENVVSAAGTTYCLDEALLCRLIRTSGYVPAQRDNAYNHVKVHEGSDSPDLRVTDWSMHRVAKLQQQKADDAPPAVELTVSR